MQLLQVVAERLFVPPDAGWLMLRKLLAAAPVVVALELALMPAAVALVLALLAGAFGLAAAGVAESTR